MNRRMLNSGCRWLLLMLLLVAGAAGQTTTTVTGTIKDLAQNVVTSGQVTFELRPGIDTTISGNARFVPTTITCSITNVGQLQSLSGGACVVTQNTAIQPAGTYYLVTLAPNFVPTSKFNWYAVGSSQDITTVVPTPATSAAYGFVDTISNQSIGGSKSFSGALSAKWIEGVANADVFGAVPGGSATSNTSALQSWLNSGATRLYLPAGVYLTGQLTLPSNVEIYGPGTLQQAAADANVFACTACANVWIHGLTFVGVGGNGLSPAPGNEDNAIHIAIPTSSQASANIRIDHVVFTGFLHDPAWIQNGKDVHFDDNYIYSSGGVVRLEGVTEATVVGNIARDTSLSNTIFQAGIALPGTAGGYATDEHIVIAHNVIANYPNTQAVLIHSCTDCTVADNHLVGVNQGIGIAPAVSTDAIVRPDVRGNTYESTSVAGGSTGNQCIFLAGSATANALQPVIVYNVCYDANLVDQNAGEGGIGLSYTSGAVVQGNALYKSYVSGIYLNNVNTDLRISDNMVQDGQAIGGLNEGIYLPSGQGPGTTGWIGANTIAGYLDGMRFDTSAAGLNVDSNTYAAISGSDIVSPGNVTVATTFLGTVSAQLQGDSYPSVVLDGPNRRICLGAGSVACDVTMYRGNGGTAAFNAQVVAPSANISGSINASSYEQSGTAGSIIYAAGLTTTAAASDALSIAGATSSSHCALAPTNAAAASASASTYISAKSAGSVTVVHPATANMTFDVMCTAN